MQQDQPRMRCRHCNAPWALEWEYCPECHRNYGGAVYPEKQTARECADVDHLIAVITAAFHGVKLDGGTTIHEADLEGAYTEEHVRIAARKKDPETEWTAVPDWKIERFSAALSFLDSKGWRFYIPAYMIWTLKNWRTCDSLTADWVIWGFEPLEGSSWSISRYGVLSTQQAEAVYQFLRFFCEYSGESEPENAIRAYWHQFAPNKS